MVTHVMPATLVDRWNGTRERMTPIFRDTPYDYTRTTTSYEGGVERVRKEHWRETHKDVTMVPETVGTTIVELKLDDGGEMRFDIGKSFVHPGDKFHVVCHRILFRSFVEVYRDKPGFWVVYANDKFKDPSKLLALIVAVITAGTLYYYGYSSRIYTEVGIYAGIAAYVVQHLRITYMKWRLGVARKITEWRISRAISQGRTFTKM